MDEDPKENGETDDEESEETSTEEKVDSVHTSRSTEPGPRRRTERSIIEGFVRTDRGTEIYCKYKTTVVYL